MRAIAQILIGLRELDARSTGCNVPRGEVGVPLEGQGRGRLNPIRSDPRYVELLKHGLTDF